MGKARGFDWNGYSYELPPEAGFGSEVQLFNGTILRLGVENPDGQFDVQVVRNSSKPASGFIIPKLVNVQPA